MKSIWDPYKLSELPEEQRGEVIKIIVAETEKTQREKNAAQEDTRQKRIGDSGYQTARVFVYLFIAACTTGLGLMVYNAQSGWQDVRIKEFDARIKETAAKAPPPMVCPPPPPCQVQAFDIHVTPAAPPPPK